MQDSKIHMFMSKIKKNVGAAHILIFTVFSGYDCGFRTHYIY